MNTPQSFLERVTELALVSFGCGMAIGLLILGACAGVGIHMATDVSESSGVVSGISIIVAIVIVALVFWVTKKNSDLRIARAQLDALARQQQFPSPPESTDSQTSK